MSNVSTTVGTRIFMGPPSAITDAADVSQFWAIQSTDWIELGEVTDAGTWGVTGSTASHQPLSTGVTVEVKGFISYGSRDILMGTDITNAGQKLAEEYAGSPDFETRYAEVPIKITFQSGKIEFNLVQITSFNTSNGGGDSIHGATMGTTSRGPKLTVRPTNTLTYIAGANGTITGDAIQTLAAGEDGTEVTATPDASFNFVAWSDGVATAARTDLQVLQDLTVTATFEAQ